MKRRSFHYPEDAVAIAKRIYLKTPFQAVRKFYFSVFCAMVRRRTVRTSVDGITYELNLGEVIDVALYLNRYEMDMVAAIDRLCRPGFTVLDIGANVGAHTLRFAQRVGESGRVHAFEPTDYAYEKLVRNISLNQFRNLTASKIALSDRNLPGQTVSFRSSWPTRGKPTVRDSVVDFVRLDDWLVRQKVDRVDLIKLDVDGNEYSVLAGAQALLAEQHPLILMEVWGPNFSDSLRNPFAALHKRGYRFYHITTGEEYPSVEHLKALVSSRDGRLRDYGFNIIVQ